MSLLKSKTALSLLAGAALMATSAVTTTANADGNNSFVPVTVYFTRHAEKKNTLVESGKGLLAEFCGKSKCAQELNAEGKLRAKLLAAFALTAKFSEEAFT